MATKHVLGAYTFEWNPQQMTIPDSTKVVAEVDTLNGSELFQWPATIIGQTINLYWRLMSVTMYNSLRALYVLPDKVIWNPQYLGTYEVVITELEGKYLEVILDDNGYRSDVNMKLNIRSFTAT